MPGGQVTEMFLVPVKNLSKLRECFKSQMGGVRMKWGNSHKTNVIIPVGIHQTFIDEHSHIPENINRSDKLKIDWMKPDINLILVTLPVFVFLTHVHSK